MRQSRATLPHLRNLSSLRVRAGETAAPPGWYEWTPLRVSFHGAFQQALAEVGRDPRPLADDRFRPQAASKHRQSPDDRFAQFRASAPLHRDDRFRRNPIARPTRGWRSHWRPNATSRPTRASRRGARMRCPAGSASGLSPRRAEAEQQRHPSGSDLVLVVPRDHVAGATPERRNDAGPRHRNSAQAPSCLCDAAARSTSAGSVA